jgi:hypothetical protein
MKLFDFICQEMSVLTDVPVVGPVRFELWTSMAEHKAHPASLTNEQAADYFLYGKGFPIYKVLAKVSDKQWRDFIKRIESFNPDIETPEEVFERLGQ